MKIKNAFRGLILVLVLIGAGNATVQADEIVVWGVDDQGMVSNAPPGSDFTKISSCFNSAIALREDGSIAVWGANNHGQVTNAPTGTGFIDISSGNGTCYALRADGSILAWGANNFGQVTNVPAGTGHTSVVAGMGNAFALRADGSIVGWGLDRITTDARRGIGTALQITSIPAGTGYTQIVANGWAAYALRANGTVVGWGADPYLGYDDYRLLKDIPTAAGFTAISSSPYGEEAYALTPDGSITHWGRNNFGQKFFAPGQPGSESVNPGASPNGYTAIAGGRFWACALAADGSIVQWGYEWGAKPQGNDFTAIATYYGGGIALKSVVPPNAAPTAVAGDDQAIRAGDIVELDGSASFDDNTSAELLGYSWTFSSFPGTTPPDLLGDNTATPTFLADLAGTYIVDLVVTDEAGLPSVADQVEISSENLAPTAVATVDYTLAIVGTTTYFDGSGSADPELDAISYVWEITTAPMGSTAQLVGANTATPSLMTDAEGTYEVTLTVSDFLGPGLPVSVEFVATTPANFAELKIVHACDLVGALQPWQVTTRGNQIAFCNFLKNATKDLHKGNISQAIQKINQARERTDGCVLRGSPDGNGQGMDWITDCDAQLEIYNSLTQAIEALQ